MSAILEAVSFVRPADTTAYAAGDVIGASGSTVPVTHDVSGFSGKQAWLMGCQLISSNEASTPTITRHYFSDTFTVAADNAAFNPSDANIKSLYLGSVTFDSWKAFGSNKKSQGKPDYPFSLPMGKYYVVHVVEGAYTPISAEEFTGKDSIWQEV